MTWIDIKPQPPQGWVCPSCEAVMAPFMPSCIRCVGQQRVTITSTTTDPCGVVDHQSTSATACGLPRPCPIHEKAAP